MLDLSRSRNPMPADSVLGAAVGRGAVYMLLVALRIFFFLSSTESSGDHKSEITHETKYIGIHMGRMHASDNYLTVFI